MPLITPFTSIFYCDSDCIPFSSNALICRRAGISQSNLTTAHSWWPGWSHPWSTDCNSHQIVGTVHSAWAQSSSRVWINSCFSWVAMNRISMKMLGPIEIPYYWERTFGAFPSWVKLRSSRVRPQEPSLQKGNALRLILRMFRRPEGKEDWDVRNECKVKSYFSGFIYLFMSFQFWELKSVLLVTLSFFRLWYRLNGAAWRKQSPVWEGEEQRTVIVPFRILPPHKILSFKKAKDEYSVCSEVTTHETWTL
jgi:hypothetical protein